MRHIDGKNWDAAIQTLQLIEEHFPFGTYGEQSQLELIYAYFRTAEFDAVVSAADRFIRLNPQHPNVDYAFYMRGVASFKNESSITASFIPDSTNRDLGTAKLAFEYFTELLTKYPQSPYGPDARKRMEYIRNVLARYEIHVANYYFKRGAFLAAANRGKFVVENMQGTPAVPDGLAVMTQAYELLGMEELSASALKVLKANFPDYPHLKSNGEFDYRYTIEAKRKWHDYLTFGLFRKTQYVSFDTRYVYNPFYLDGANLTAAPPR